jgi:Fe-S cluster biogenesis protein NfuA/nitrite reductase/ring-hydroxylating ferredoxin subunit
MPDRGNLNQAGERIEALLQEIRSMASPPAWQRVDELIRLILELYGSGLSRTIEITTAQGAAGEAILDQLAADELVGSLLILHGLHPDDFATRVRKALVRVRPYLGSHGGDVELLQADEASGVVRLRMAGSCETCPSSTLTVKLAVETAIREVAPEVTSIEVDGVGGADHSAHNGFGDHLPKWTALGDVPRVAPGATATAEIGGAPILLCRVDQSLYAYRDACPGCASALHGGALGGDVIVCPSCGERYDVRRAGRSTENGGLHLEPVPLLEDDAGVRIALAGASA